MNAHIASLVDFGGTYDLLALDRERIANVRLCGSYNQTPTTHRLMALKVASVHVNWAGSHVLAVPASSR